MGFPAHKGLAGALSALALLMPVSAHAKAVLVQARAEILAPARLNVSNVTDAVTASLDTAIHHQRRSRAPACKPNDGAASPRCTENLFEFE